MRTGVLYFYIKALFPNSLQRLQISLTSSSSNHFSQQISFTIETDSTHRSFPSFQHPSQMCVDGSLNLSHLRKDLCCTPSFLPTFRDRSLYPSFTLLLNFSHPHVNQTHLILKKIYLSHTSFLSFPKLLGWSTLIVCPSHPPNPQRRPSSSGGFSLGSHWLLPFQVWWTPLNARRSSPSTSTPVHVFLDTIQAHFSTHTLYLLHSFCIEPYCLMWVFLWGLRILFFLSSPSL